MTRAVTIIATLTVMLTAGAHTTYADFEHDQGNPFGTSFSWVRTNDPAERDYSFAVDMYALKTRVEGVNWWNAEQEQGVYDWDRQVHNGYLDTRIRNAQQSGIDIEVATIIGLPPVWEEGVTMCARTIACPVPAEREEYKWADCLVRLEYQDEYVNFVRAVVERYDGDGVDDMPGLERGIDTWRFGREVAKHTWCGPEDSAEAARDFVEAYELTYHAVKDADPEARMMFGGLNGAIFNCLVDYECDYDWLNSSVFAQDSVQRFDYIYNNINPDHVDILGVHPYQYWETIGGKIDAFRSSYLSPELAEKPIWAMEDGEIRKNEPIATTSDKRQAEEIIKRYVITASRNIENNFWFALSHYDENSEWRNMDIVPTRIDPHTNEYNYTRRPGYYTYRLMVTKLKGFSDVTIHREDTNTYYHYEFTVRGTPIHIFWTADDATHALPRQSGVDTIVTNIITERGTTTPHVTYLPAHNTDPFMITQTPIFVEYVLSPTASLSADPETITYGQSTTLTWTSTYASQCLGTNFATNGSVTGTATLSPTTSTTYSLACTGAGGTAHATATVLVTLAGDVNGDGTVNIFDYNLVLTYFGSTSCGVQGDTDDDCDVDIFDYNTVLTQFGMSG